MSAFEIVPASPDGRVSLRDMPPGTGWVAPCRLGMTPEEQIAIRDGTISPGRKAEIYEAGQRANDELVRMDVPGVKDWMPYHRIFS